MLAREVIVDTVVCALRAAYTIAGNSIYSERDWPLTEPMLPSIVVKCPADRKESLVRGIPQFTSTATINILARVSAPTSQEVVKLLSIICYQIERAILVAGSPVQQLVQQFTTVDTETRTTSENAKPLGDALLSIGCEYYEEFQADDTAGLPLMGIAFELSQPGTDAPTILAGVDDTTLGVPTTFTP